jgi:hypothetical protein
VSNSSDETAVWYHFVVEPNAEPASYNWAWNGVAYPAGGITAWRGVNSTGCSSGSTKCQAFDAAPVVDQGTGAIATAPSITTKTLKAQVLSIFGAGEATGLAFGLPVSNKPGIGTDETGALVVNGGPTIKSYYAHLVADRIGASSATDPGPTDPQTVTLSSSNQGDPTMSNWTAISIALRPE